MDILITVWANQEYVDETPIHDQLALSIMAQWLISRFGQQLTVTKLARELIKKLVSCLIGWLMMVHKTQKLLDKFI